jgi:hypothetical protein
MAYCTALANNAPLALRQGSEQVKQERVGIGSKLHRNERHLVDHKAADEVHIAAEPIKLGNNYRSSWRP